jgi:signal peptidase II
MNSKIIKYGIMIIIMLGGTFADFQSKRWAQETLRDQRPHTVISGILDFGFAENRGMVFGILNNQMNLSSRNILTGLRILILIGLTIFIWYNFKQKIVYLFPFFLFWAGAVGNLIDPFIYGYVVDFIHIQLWNWLNWPFYFNLADAYVTIGIILMLLNGSLYKKTETAQ